MGIFLCENCGANLSETGLGAVLHNHIFDGKLIVGVIADYCEWRYLCPTCAMKMAQDENDFHKNTSAEGLQEA